MPTWTKPFPKNKPFKCGAYWHFKNSGLFLAIYDLIGAVSQGGKTPFYASIKSVSKYFDADYETCRRIFAVMRRDGWLDLRIDRHHYYVPHDIRAEKYPSECCKRELLDWQVDTDPFVGQLHALSGGKLRVFENQVVGFRKIATEEEFLEAFRKELAAAEERRKNGSWDGTSPKSCLWKVATHFNERQRAKVLSSR
jgi:hypothetical protein